ncbi:MAG TPA: hypothetical protein VL919_06280, partial [Vicinamibacterales bacterium]|nr:hypothetical protein [Vicinamibacterales bacterium]
MTMPLWTVGAYALQLAALVTVAFAATWLLRIRAPRHSLRFWQAVLAIALLAPLAQPRSVNNPAALAFISQSISTPAIPQGGTPVVAAGLDSATIVLWILAAGIVARLLWLSVGIFRLRSIVAGATADDSLRDLT